MKTIILSVSDETLSTIKATLDRELALLRGKANNLADFQNMHAQWLRDTAADLEDVLLQLDRPQPTSKPNLKDG